MTNYEPLKYIKTVLLIKMTTKNLLGNKGNSPDEVNENYIIDGTSEASTTDSNSRIAFVDSLELPSAVTDREEIYMPPDVSIEDPRIYGKWLFFSNGDLKLQDYLWIHLQPLLGNGDVILLASSTAKKCPNRGPLQGVIKCYTHEDIGMIKRVGVAMQDMIQEDIILNYKTNQASKDSLYRGFGIKFITKYMLTANRQFYEKDKLERWNRITDFADISTSISSRPKFLPSSRRQQSGSEFPSREAKKKKYVYPKEASLHSFAGIWSLFCNFVETDDSGVTELDHIWNEVRLLSEEGYFSSTFCETSAFKPHPADNALRRTIICELKDFLDIDRVILTGDKLRERTSYNMPIYLKVCFYNDRGKLKYHLKYLYTDNRELYEYIDQRWKLLKKA